MVGLAASFMFTFDATVEHNKLIRAIWELREVRKEERGNKDQLKHPSGQPTKSWTEKMDPRFRRCFFNQEVGKEIRR